MFLFDIQSFRSASPHWRHPGTSRITALMCEDECGAVVEEEVDLPAVLYDGVQICQMLLVCIVGLPENRHTRQDAR